MFNANDLRIVKNPGSRQLYRSEDRDTSGETSTKDPGEPVKRGGTGSNFVTLLANGDPEIGTDIFVGIVASVSTETATADGVVSVTGLRVSSVIEGRPTTSGNMDTESELNDLLLESKAFDLASGAFTIDEDETDAVGTLGLFILNGDLLNLTLDVLVDVRLTISGR